MREGIGNTSVITHLTTAIIIQVNILRAPLECYKLLDLKHPGKASLLLRMTQVFKSKKKTHKKNATSVQKKDYWRLAEIQ